MPAETFHASHQGPLPGERVTESGIIIPAGVHYEPPAKEAVSLDTSTEGRAEASLTVEEGLLEQTIHERDAVLEENAMLRDELAAIKQQLAELQGGGQKELADNQPRRVRHQDGATDKLVKYSDGSFEWEDTVTGERKSVEAVAETPDIEPEEASSSEAPAPTPELTPEDEAKPQSLAGKELERYVAPEQEKDTSFEPLLDAELLETLNLTRDNYAEITAKNRNGHWGYFLHESKYLSKIPGLQKLADRQNEQYDAKEIGPAREAYKQAILAVQQEIHKQSIEAFGATPEAFEQIRLHASDVAIQSDAEFELKVASVRMEASGTTNKFINWWVRQEGLGGKLKKAAVIAGAGLTAGVVAGLASVPLVGIAVGAGIGLGTGAYVTKKRASGLVAKNGDVTLAQEQLAKDSTVKEEHIQSQLESQDGFVSANGLVDVTEDRTGKEKQGNRNRLRSATAAGIIGATAGASVGRLVRGGLDALAQQNAQVEADTPPKATATEAQPTATEAAPQTPELQGTDFAVEPGSGYTQELMNFAQANGHQLTPDQSWQLHQDLVNQFGADYIDINGAGNDVYTEAGDIRLAEPGAAVWHDGVGQFVQQWMTTRGLW